tara:strand:+ start:122 stop:1915 length:1794 start_codon:yes stop_codon:yes gene_type:complete
MAYRAGLAPDAYWQTLHPKAKEHHLSRVGAPVAPYVTAEQYANSQAVGANSGPNAFISNNPVLAGYDGNPMQPGYPGSGPSLDVSPALSPNRDSMLVQDAPGALSDPARSDASIVTPRPGQNPETLRNALLKRPGNRTQDIPGYGPVETPALSNPEENMANFQPAPGYAASPVLSAPKAEPKSYEDKSVTDFLIAAEGANTTSVGDNHIGSAPGNPIEMPASDNSYLKSLDSETLRELAANGNLEAVAELDKRASAPGYKVHSSMETPGPVLTSPSVDDPRTPALMADGSAANRAVASSGGVLEDPTAAPSAAKAALSQSNSSNVGNSGGGNRTTGSTAQSTSRSMSPSTGNARGSQMGYGKANTAEMLMRVGGVMQANAVNGYGAAMGAASNEYGKIQDQRRAADTAAYEAQEKKDAAKRLAAAKVRAAGAKAGGAGGKAAAANAKALSGVNDAMYGMQQGLDAIAASRAAGGNLTGIGGIFKGLIDNFTGDADANRRLTLSRLKVNDALLRTAETKGAISNSEMKLFLSPAPTNMQDEQVWVDWLNQRMAALQRVQERLNGGVVLSDAERSTNFNTTSGTFTPSADVQAALDKYK